MIYEGTSKNLYKMEELKKALFCNEYIWENTKKNDEKGILWKNDARIWNKLL